ncbi:MAG: metallophosphoesterase, partial [Deltaproteobacteria bacterium]
RASIAAGWQGSSRAERVMGHIEEEAVKERGLVRRLFDGPIDVVGDVHGEIDALHGLMARLGYDARGVHPAGRRLVFLGDLPDRGPDSLAVIDRVRGLVDEGLAQCILGNHELNLLLDKRRDGNHWFYPEPAPKEDERFGKCARVDPARRADVLAFFDSLPLALERDDLRVVHAAWDRESIETCRAHDGSMTATYHALERPADPHLEAEGKREERELGPTIHDPDVTPRFLSHLARYDEQVQMGHPIRILASGVERVTATPFFASNKWRFVERVRWWREYQDSTPVIFGHYWRRQSAPPPDGGEPYLFDDAGPTAWLRGHPSVGEVAFCADYSVGLRFRERKAGRRSGFDGRLAALRWPEREVVFDEG